ncbi:MAG: DUF1833 domain-containing protein [Gammaproteobacteria bacterium]|nr:DUF1833 domain-containing protein [Gammaproteobacteria bacterium]
MPREYSKSRNLAVNRTASRDYPVILLEISHADLTTPVRVVKDNVDLTSNGDLFVAMPFDITLPDDPQGGLPKASLSIDNVGKELMGWLESSNGGQGSSCRIMEVLRSDPNTIEWEATMQLDGISATPLVVSGRLSFDDILNKPAVLAVHDQSTTPGIF